MKTMILKMMAKIVLDNIGDVVVWAMEKACDTYVKDSDKMKRTLEVAEEVSASAGKVAGVMKDGKVTDEEAAAILADVNATAEKLKALL